MSIKSLPALETALAHRSIRKFSDKPVPPEILAALMDAGRMASTSNHLQCVSVIRITDAAIRAGIRRAASDMAYVTECPEFLLFCVDFHKHHLLLPEAQTDWAEALLIGAVDTGIMAQNMLLVAESLGLGGVYIGALRNDIAAVAELVGLPAHYLPLVGLCLGYPAQDPPVKPRLPQEVVLHENRYREPDPQAFAAYDEELRAYYTARTGEARDWLDAVQNTLGQPLRPHVLAFLQAQGFIQR